MAEKTDAQKAKEKAEEARRAREEAARKARIRREIREQQNKVKDLSSVKQELTSEQSHLGTSIGKWETAKNTFYQEDISKRVVITNVFEGTAATAEKQANAEKISAMDEKVKSASSVKDGISTQIGKIDTKISSINSKISALQSQI